MEEIYLWGAGAEAYDNKYVIRAAIHMGINIKGFIDSNSQRVGEKYLGLKINSPEYLINRVRDNRNIAVVICSEKYFADISNQIRFAINLRDCNIYDFNSFFGPMMIEEIKKHILENDPEKAIKMEALEGAQFDTYFPNIGRNISLHEVFYEDDYPYIVFEGKRMYYPKHSQFYKENGKEYVKDILREQMSESPHLYIKKDWVGYKPNGVLIDAGVCEGNFALRYVENLSHLYLIEPDPKWTIPLQKTFAPWKSRVTFCWKLLDDEEGVDSTTLDNLIEEKYVDFLKMDIEGFETKALMGGMNVLRNGIGKSAICSYHKNNAYKEIRDIFNACGYHTDSSNGYMFFKQDPDQFEGFNLRKGIVYAEKGYSC